MTMLATIGFRDLVGLFLAGFSSGVIATVGLLIWYVRKGIKK